MLTSASMRRFLLSSWVVVLAALAGVASLWNLEEQDIYWQIRAGDDLWQTGVWPHTDTWTFSAAGTPWLNTQWLSTLLFRACFALGQEAALVTLRGVLVAALMGLLGSIVLRVTRHVSALRRAFAAGICLPLAYTALLPRFQIRSDLLVLLVFAALLRVWVGGTTERRKRVATLAIILLAANLHTGTAPFVLLVGITFLVARSDRWQQAMLWGAAAVLSFFATPYTVDTIPVVWSHLFYFQNTQLTNPDHLTLSWDYLRSETGAAWLGILGLTAAAWPLARRRLPAPYQAAVPFWLISIILFALACNRVRAIPYGVVFAVPVFAAALGRLRIPHAVLATAAVGAVMLVTTVVQPLIPLIGFTASDVIFPIGSTRFLRQAQAQPNLLHTSADGAYLVWNLRGMPNYVDTRESLFWPIEHEVISAFRSPRGMAAVLQKYHINAVLLPIMSPRYDAEGAYVDMLERYLPRSDWALVYFDRISSVLVKRIPEHAKLIAENEYKYIRPNAPADVEDPRVSTEVERCLSDEPQQSTCLALSVQ